MVHYIPRPARSLEMENHGDSGGFSAFNFALLAANLVFDCRRNAISFSATIFEQRQNQANGTASSARQERPHLYCPPGQRPGLLNKSYSFLSLFSMFY
jgi:hypothetical protein